MRVVAFVPAKGTSERIENKNTKLLDGKPLLLHTLEKLVNCDFIDEVYLDTDSDSIIELASEVDCNVLKRDPSLATNKTDGHQLFYNQVRQVEADIYIQVLVTSPFIHPDTIKSGVEALQRSEVYDSAILVRKEKQYTWENNQPTYDLNRIPNSIDLSDTTIETMGLYIVKRESAHQLQRRIGESPLLLEASALEAIDVNWPEDFVLANYIAAGIREESRKLLGTVKLHLSSSLLSDLLDDLGFPNQVVRGLKPNMPDTKILGPAKTLKLRALRDNEPFEGIYDALHSYETVIPNDVIVIENEVPEFAYFGELNANLALRQGAAGVIVGGNTRDSREVLRTGLAVFSTGVTCQDVRKRATVESINKSIQLRGVSVRPNDLVFADSEGVVIISSLIEKRLFDLLFTRLSDEKNILVDISQGSDVAVLTRRYGFF